MIMLTSFACKGRSLTQHVLNTWCTMIEQAPMCCKHANLENSGCCPHRACMHAYKHDAWAPAGASDVRLFWLYTYVLFATRYKMSCLTAYCKWPIK